MMVSVMKLFMFPGCALKTTAKGFESSALSSASCLGIELIELPNWNCCGTVHSLSTDDVMHHLAPLRNLLKAQEVDHDLFLESNGKLVTFCSLCFNTLKRSSVLIREDTEKRNIITSYLEKEENPQFEVVNFLEILKEIGYDTIKNTVKKPLKGLAILPYYGCMLLRPKEIGIDDPEDPHVLENLLTALGADIVDSPYKTKCCGSYHTVANKRLAMKLSYKILNNSENNGANAIATSCPLCAFNLDNLQKEISQEHPSFRKIPIFYYTQLMALSFDLKSESLGLSSNYVDPRPLLKKIGL